jgi:hypothetical protein
MTRAAAVWVPGPDRYQAYEPLYASYTRRLAAVSSLDGVSLGADDQGAAARRAGQDRR